MSASNQPPRRFLWSKYAWKTIRQAIRSTPQTIRFVAILTTIIFLPTIATAISVSVVCSVYL